MLKSIQNELTLLANTMGYSVDQFGVVRNSKNKVVRSFINGKNGNSYLVFSIRNLSLWDYAKKVKVHKLQAYQKFRDKIFEEGIVVRHLDGNPLNNSWDNIEIGNQSDNMLDIPKEIRIKSATVASRKMQDNSRSFEERCKIYEDLNSGLTYSEIMKKHNISSKGTLSFIKNKSKEYKEYLSPSSK